MFVWYAGVMFVGITKGDNLVYTSEFFRCYLSEAGAVSYEYATAEQTAKAKRLAEADLGLNPEQMVASYSGRLPAEKAGRNRIFTDVNIETMVKAGIQVIIYGNVQPYAESEAIASDLESLAKRLENANYPGRFIFNRQFDIIQERKLFAATDLRVFDPDRYTGACENSEANAPACGAIVIAPPYWEGNVQRQGGVINWRTKVGNIVIPQNTKPESYLSAVLKVNAAFKAGELSVFQAQSIRFSRVIGALLTGAQYLRFWNSAFYGHKAKAPRPRVNGEVHIEEVSLQAYGKEGIRHFEREGNNFWLNNHDQGEIELSVMIHLESWDVISYGEKPQEVPFDMVRAALVSDYGIAIPLCIKRTKEDKAE